MIDSYRRVHPTGGFTWGHRNTSLNRSRIDRIFTPSTINVLDSTVITDFDQSDHSLIITKIAMKHQKPRGPGCYKINPTVLDNEYVRNDIEAQLRVIIEQVPQHFDPHIKWDYIKLSVCNIFMEACSIEKKSNKFELETVENELNLLHARRDQLMAEGNLETDLIIRTLELEIKRCSDIVDKQREIEAKNLIYLSRAQWAEEGEKSTKYFLNLIKTRSTDSTIHSIKT